MTFFLSDKPTKAAPVNVAPERPAGWWETAGAAWNQTQVLQDTLFHGEMTDRALLEEINDQLGDASPYAGDGLQIAWERSGRWDPIRAKVLSAAARAARNEPGMWGSLPLNEEAFHEESRRRRMAELEDAQATLAMGSGMAAETLGGMARATTDPVSLAMLPAGGSGSLLRILATEAALGAAGEAIALPQQYRVAQELDQPDPDPLVQIGLGAAAGGVLGTAPVAVSRGASRLVGRSETAGAQRPANAHPADHEARAASAEAAVREGRSINVSPPVADAQIATAARRIVGAESGGRAAAKNSESTATGLGQFIESTWLEVIGRNRPDIAAGRTRKELLALRTDADLSWEMTVAYTRENAATLEAAGLSPSIENLYLAHFLGPGGAVRALTADPSAPISRVMDADQIQANRNISYGGRKLPGWTVADLRRWSETKMGLAEDPGDAWRASSRRGYTAPDQVTTPQGTRVAVTYEVVDLDELIFATGGRQNRDRSRPAPTAEVTRRAAELDPALLMPAASAGHGAPIVGPDRIIDSGNGRVMSILHAAQHVPDRYAAYVETIRSQFEIPAGVKRPVLVAVREELDGPTLERFVREANSDSIERLSATEQARTDAAAIDRDLLGLYDPEAGGPFGAGNARFVQGLVDRLPPAERGQVLTADRRLSAQGRERLRSALFSRAYDAPDLTAAQAEQGGGDVRSIVEALTDAAPAWAQMRAAVEAGEIGEAFDLTADLLDAIRLVQQARREAAEQGVSVRGAIEDALAQGDMFGGGPSPATARLVGILYRGGQARSREAMADTLQRFALEARTVGAADDLLAGAGVRGPLDVLDTLSARLEAEPPRAGDAPDGADAAADGGPQVDVAGVDDARWNDGASSPAAIEGAAQAEAELRQELAASRAGVDAEQDPAVAAGERRAALDRETDELAEAQPFDDLDELFALAPAAQSQLEQLGASIAERLGVKFKNPGLKGRETTAEKVQRKRYASVRQLTDIARGGFVVDTVDQADAIAQAFRDAGLRFVDEGWTIKEGSGFVDRKILLQTESGVLAEVQIWTAPMLEAKASRGQKLYTAARSSGDPEEIARLNAEQAELYADALSRSDLALAEIVGRAKSPNLPPNMARNVGSSGTSEAVSPTSSRSTSTHSPPGSSSASATSSTTTTGRRSQFANRMGDTSSAGDNLNLSSAPGEFNSADEIRAAVDEIRAAIGGDFTIDTHGPEGTLAASEILADLEADLEFVRVVEICGYGGARNA